MEDDSREYHFVRDESEQQALIEKMLRPRVIFSQRCPTCVDWVQLPMEGARLTSCRDGVHEFWTPYTLGQDLDELGRELSEMAESHIERGRE